MKSFLLKSLILIVVSFVIAFISAAFMAGYTNCEDCDTSLDRIFLGIIWIFIGILTKGKIPADEGNMSNVAVNIWSDVYLIWGILSVISICMFLLLRYRVRNSV
jgi:hypothetical protein